jgi:hypothetical protein
MQASGSLAGGERWRVCVKTSEVDGGAEGSLRIRTRDQRVRVLEIMHRCAVLPWDTKTGSRAHRDPVFVSVSLTLRDLGAGGAGRGADCDHAAASDPDHVRARGAAHTPRELYRAYLAQPSLRRFRRDLLAAVRLGGAWRGGLRSRG